MDSTNYVFFGFALIGVAYFLLYRFVFHVYFKWKMLHSIWLPLAVTVFSLIVAASAFFDTTGWGDLIAIVSIMLFNAPVVAFFILFGLDALLSRKKKVVA